MQNSYDVIIIGGGPTGVALGIELGSQHIRTLILEKHPSPLLSPRAQSLNARTMEFFKRWKIAAQLKAEILLPPDYPLCGVWCSQLNGKTYACSSSNDLLTDDISPERGIRIPLWLTEKVLRKRLQDFPSVTFLKSYHATDLQIHHDSVTVMANNTADQAVEFIAPFVVGCDGTNSITRTRAQIDFTALAPSQRVLNVLFESQELEKKITVAQGFLYYLLESPHPGAIGPVSLEQGLWYAQIKDSSQANTIDELNVSQILEGMSGFPFEKKILQAHFWQMHIQIASSFAKHQRIFLVGDSAHAFVPTGGFGLNTGLGDAVNLGWKLAAVIQGQAQPSLLMTYEQERQPVCLHNLNLAQKNADDLVALRKKHNPQTDPVAFAEGNVQLAKQYTHALAATMGYCYRHQPQTPTHTHAAYTPIVEPGYFLPHRWLAQRQSIYDELSATHWTLLVMDATPSITLQMLKKICPTVQIMSLPKETYSLQFILIRPDWHIVYASNTYSFELLQQCLQNYALCVKRES